MELNGKHVAILVEDTYEDLEFWYPNYRLREAGARVTVVGTEKTTYRSKRGYEAEADAASNEVEADAFDALVIPGGYAPDRMRRCAATVELVRAMHVAGRPVAFICHAGWIPASADIVRGRRVTSFPSIADDLRNAGAEWVDEEVVRDGNLISSRVPGDLPAFCRELIDALGSAS
ncbi:MAG: type 1 glutamine amidotransferase domain-containing protein [Gammaproteobacteria bacterium]|nr:type 1 glutamine amidotransferase domain-containing protein [Gammaproteobacteria bacterium]